MDSSGDRLSRAALRRSVLAVVVLDDLDAEPRDDGVHVRVAAGEPVVPWSDVAAAVRGRGDPTVPVADAAPVRLRVRDWLLAHRVLQGTAAAGVDVRGLLLPLAMPVGSAAHLGEAWHSRRVLGGAMDVGLGVAVPDRGAQDPRVVPLPVPVADRLGIGVGEDLPPDTDRHLERMGTLAAQRLRRDEGARDGHVLRPVGGCDVPTLLAARSLREHLADGDPGGLRAVAVPMRGRGWFDLRRVDPAFVGAAWSATELEQRAFPQAVLVTRDEVTLPAADVDLPQRSLRV